MENIELNEGLVKIGDFAFNCCSNLNGVNIPTSVTEIGSCAFADCESLITIEIKKNVNLLGERVFARCFGLKQIEVEEDNQNYCSENGALYNKTKTELICCPAGIEVKNFSVAGQTTTVKEYAFEVCNNLEEIILPDELTKIENFAFYECKNLTTMVIPNKIEIINEATFMGCENLKEIKIPEKVETIKQWAFANCTKLEKIVILDNVIEIDNETFISSENVTIYCYEDSFAHIFAEMNAIKYVIIGENENSYQVTEKLGISYLRNISPKVTLSEFMTKVQKDGPIARAIKTSEEGNDISLKVYKGDEAITKNNTIITTNMKLILIIGNTEKEYILVVTGDVDGNGKADLTDILAINKQRLNKATLSGAFVLAGDVDRNDKVNLTDILKINKYRLGKAEL